MISFCRIGLDGAYGVEVAREIVALLARVRIPLGTPIRYFPGTSLTLYTGHMVYTFWYIPSSKGGRYALDGDQCHG